jgi:PBSX family phage terminase large subunit
VQRRSILEATARLNIWHGPVRSGKSIASLIRFIDYVAHDGPKTGEFFMIGKTVHALRRNIITPMEEMLGSECVYRKGDQIIRLWGRTINVVGANDEGSETRIRGSTSAGTYGDELVLWPAGYFRMATSRMSITGSKLFGTTNPDSPQHWLKKDYIDRAKEVNARCFTWGLRKNSFLDAEYIDQIEKEYTGLWRKRFIDGLWVLAEGAIYDMFRDERHIIQRPETKPDQYIVGVDYGTDNPACFVLIAVKEIGPGIKIAWAEREYYWDSSATLRQKTDLQYANDMKDFVAERSHRDVNVWAIYVDPSAASFKLELERKGFYQVEDANNDVADGIRTVSRMLHQGRYKICAECEQTVKQKASYVWDPKKAKRGIEQPIKTDDHAVDAERYALHSYFGPDSVLWTGAAY